MHTNLQSYSFRLFFALLLFYSLIETAVIVWRNLYGWLEIKSLMVLVFALATHLVALTIIYLALKLVEAFFGDLVSNRFHALFVALFAGAYPAMYVNIYVQRQALHGISFTHWKSLLIFFVLEVTAPLTVYLIWGFLKGRMGVASFRKFGTVALTAMLTMALLFVVSVVGKSLVLSPTKHESQAIDNHLPNMLLIAIDTLRADHLGAYGNPDVYTPNLDRLSKSSLLWPRAVCEMPLTGPSFSTILSGAPAYLHGVQANGQAYQSEILLLPELLSQRGYRTAAFISGFPLRNSLMAWGERFDLYYDNATASPLLPDELRDLMWYQVIERLGFMGFINIRERKAADTAHVVKKWLRFNADNTFFGMVHFFDPHTPYEPPLASINDSGFERKVYDPYFEKRSPASYTDSEHRRIRELYRLEVASVDLAVGEIMVTLSELGLLEKTIIIVTADHGESLGEHDYYYDHGKDLFEPSLRVPFYIHFPQKYLKLANLNNANIQSGMWSLCWIKPFFQQMLDKYDTLDKDIGKIIKLIQEDNVLLETSGRLTVNMAAGSRLAGIRGEDWKYIQGSDGRKHWYDLSNDPQELNPLPIPGETLSIEMRKALKAILTSDTAANAPKMDQETQRILDSLGYVKK